MKIIMSVAYQAKKNATTEMVLHKAHYVSSLLTKNTLVHRAMQQH